MKAKIKKSRFGSDARECTFKIMWAGDDVKIQDQESWLEAVKSSSQISNAGAWFTLKHEDGSEEKFQTATWMKNSKRQVQNCILQIMEEEVILKFEKKEVDAKEFYDIDGEDE